jgi:predicted phosphate transport protein (TIGR00153 family)
MFNNLLPREDNFFLLFTRHAEQMQRCAKALDGLFSEMKDIELRVRDVEGIEKEADNIVRETTSLLHSTFITPFDRDQIHLLITRMDDVVDLMEDVAQTILLYDVKLIPPGAAELKDLCLEGVDRIVKMVALLSDMKNAKAILALAAELKEIEGKTDYVARDAIAKLFRGESDYREFIKAKELYELLETVTDRADDVADVAKGVVLENT